MWTALANAQSINLTDGINRVSRIDIQDTQLQTLNGFNTKAVDIITIANNPYMTNLSIPLSNIGTNLTVQANGKNFNAELPNFPWANNVKFRNISLLSMPSINYINNYFGLYGNNFKEFGVGRLGVIKGSLGIASNPTLTNISLPSLLSISSLRIKNNTKVKTINGFAELGTISCPLNLSGNFSEYGLVGLRQFMTAMLTRTVCHYPRCRASSIQLPSRLRTRTWTARPSIPVRLKKL